LDWGNIGSHVGPNNNKGANQPKEREGRSRCHVASCYDSASNEIEKFGLQERWLMKFPGGFNIQQMMKQAQVMQEKMQKEMEELRVDASAGGGVVTVQMKGNHEIVALRIDPEAIKDGDVEMLQDMVVAATNEANRKVDEAMKGKLGGMLPPGLGGLLGSRCLRTRN